MKQLSYLWEPIPRTKRHVREIAQHIVKRLSPYDWILIASIHDDRDPVYIELFESLYVKCDGLWLRTTEHTAEASRRVIARVRRGIDQKSQP